MMIITIILSHNLKEAYLYVCIAYRCDCGNYHTVNPGENADHNYTT